MKPVIGGQAVIEGVMMRGSSSIATAVRKPDGSIVVEKQIHTSITEKYRILKFPVVRGVVFLFEMMIVGLSTLNWSANQQLKQEEQLSSKGMAATVAFSMVLALGLFVGLPYLLTRFITGEHNLTFNLIDGGFRLGIFLAYLGGISFMKDVKRLFQYHGAEHKAVNCYEAGLPLTVKNVQKFKTIHPRCGTSLIVFVIAVSIVLFSLIRTNLWYVNIGARIVIIPLIAGLSYELLKLGARFYSNVVVRALVQPGLWVQGITTKQPDDKQVEVSINALKAVL